MMVCVVIAVFLAISHTPIYSTRTCCVHICSCLIALCILYFAYVDCATLRVLGFLGGVFLVFLDYFCCFWFCVGGCGGLLWF